MRDQKLDRWAEVLVCFSLGVQKNQTVFVVADLGARPLLEAVYERLILIGAKVEVMVLYRELNEFLLKNGSDEQILFTPLARLTGVKAYDHYLFLGAISNSKMLSGIFPERQKLAALANKPIVDVILERSAKEEMRWCVTMYPTPAAAQEAEMGNIDYENFVLNAGFLCDESPASSWRALEQQQANLIRCLENKKELRFQNSEGTDLKVNIENMKWVNCCGRINFPDGEIYTGPNLKASDGGVNGVVRYSLPTIYRNVEICDIELVFEKGMVKHAKAAKNEHFLLEMIAQDPGAKFVGEIAIGTNYRINKGVKDILFDEKIGGTFHLALGKGYPETGNTNESALHWDIIFDMRQGGSIHADGELISKNGKFVHSDWPHGS